MNRFFIVVFLIFATGSVNAQIHEVGVFLGGSNYIGDIGKMSYVAPKEPAFGVMYKWNRSPRHAWRASVIMSKIKGNDLDSPEPSRKIRGYKFENNLVEASLGLEFNFFEFNLHEEEPKFTPYIYSGLSIIHYDGLFFVGGETRSNAPHTGVALPMIVGLKGRLINNLILGFEVGARWSFHDDLDGSNPKNGNLESLKFGNVNSTDWYVFTGFSLTYTFGNKPCYCAD